ncbi:MAG: hypothetical protein WD972_00695 [Candidatus Andersenbacteria bacterium]
MAANSPNELTGIDDDKLFAVLSYLLILVVVPLFVKRNDPFIQFHAKQGLVILIGFILSLIAAQWLPSVGSLLFIVLLIVDMIALVQALLGRRWKIPLIGELAQKFNI